MKIRLFFVIFFLFLIQLTQASKINVAILWHQHQPDYKSEGIYQAPWVRLHAIKDYVDMVTIIEKYPGIRLNVNLVPSLLFQIEDYVYNDAEDIFTILMKKNPENLTYEEKNFILERSFDISWKNVIPEHEVYYEFLNRRGKENYKVDEAVISKFSAQDFRDLMVWFNLSWFDSDFYPLIEKFLIKKRNYSDNDIKELLSIQKKIMAQIIPIHRNLMARGRLELTSTPYYHPILPLIYNTEIAEISYDGIMLPEKFSYTEDAKLHVKKAVDFHKERFRTQPSGMWPGEGSVSKDVIDLFTENNINWIATGDEVLSKSIGKSFRRNSHNIPDNAFYLYRPYIVKGNNSEIKMVFRDGELSDKLGFEYANISPEEAVEDFKNTLYRIRKKIPEHKDILITIILDGENAWENYKNDGKDFFHQFYSFLSTDPDVETVLISEYLKKTNNTGVIESLWPGSWINGDFAIWIGEEEENIAWNYLGQARKLWEERKNLIDKKNHNQIMNLFMKAQGSDWFWWFGKDQDSGNDIFFDEMFRQTLKKIYYLMGITYPHYLDNPIIQMDSEYEQALKKFFLPEIDGIIEKDWDYGYKAVNPSGASVMRRSGQYLTEFRYTTWENFFYYVIEFNQNVKVEDIEKLYLETESQKIPLKETYFKYKDNVVEGMMGENPARIKVSYADSENSSLPVDKFVEVKYSYRNNLETMLFFEDVKGDDYGSGTYTYPTNSAFELNSFDLTFFELAQDLTDYYFIVGISDIDNVWNSQTGISVQTVDIYINSDGNTEKTALGIDRNAYAAGKYNYFINVEGWHRELTVYNSAGKEISKTNAVNAFVHEITGELVIKISKAFFNHNLTESGFIIALMGQDGSKSSRIRPVIAERDEWNFGGGFNKVNTNIIDVIDTGNQKEILSGEREIPYLKAVNK